MASVEIRALGKEEPPWDLLLLADPSRAKVADYLEEGTCFVAYSNDHLVGEFVLLQISVGVIKIVNMAVAPEVQGGIGRQLVNRAKEIAKKRGAHLLEVGTGNSSLGQLIFYQKYGFRISGIEPDFFVGRYPEKIIENGIQCVDMIRLSLKLT